MELSLIQDFSFLNALGIAILQSLWQCFLLWALYETIIVASKNINSKRKHNLSALFVFASFIWFVFTFISKLFTDLDTNQYAGFITSEFNGNVIHDSLNQFAAFSGNAVFFLSVAYLFLLFLFLIKLFIAYLEVKLVAQKSLISAPVYLQNFAEEVSNQLKIPRRIKVWVSENIDVPATIGFFKPVILIPFSSITNLTPYQLEAILLHEICHIKRNDYLVNLLISLIETVLFFNPFLVLLVKSIKRERENCCDDFVLMYRYDAHTYASALLQLEKFRNRHVELSLSAVSNKKQLFSRVKRIMGHGTNRQSNYVYRLLALIIITSILCLLNINLASMESKKTMVGESNSPKNNLILKSVSGVNSLIAQENKKDERNLNSIPGKEIAQTLKGKPKEKGLKNPDVQNSLSIQETKNDVGLINPQAEEVLNFDQKPGVGMINEALQLAMTEIKNLDWRSIEKDINKSLEQVNKQTLFADQVKLNKSINGSPRINIKADLSEALKQFKNVANQKVSFDSLKVAENLLLALKATQIAVAESERLQKLFEDPTFKAGLHSKSDIKAPIDSRSSHKTLKL